MAAVGARLDEFGDDTVVAVVVFTTGPLPSMALPVLRDPDRSAYRALGFGRGSIRRVWGWRATKAYVRLLRRDGVRSLRPPTEDPQQLGGNVIFDRNGEVAWIHRSAGPDDRPSVDELLAAVGRV